MMLCIASTSLTSCEAQVKNAKIETVKIYGNCGMCETTIETAGNVKKVAKVDWDKDTKIAIITYDSTKTNQDEILKRIALAGYDSDKFLAPDDVYSKLHGCCQYERVTKTAIFKTDVVEDHSSHNHDATTTEKPTETSQEVNQLKSIIDNYFAAFDTEHIEETKDAGHQRDHFTSLSKNMYALIKVSKQETTIYYQNCPMYNDGKGANWLSKESTIKNPYYGSQMLSCGKTVETIK